MVGPKRPCYSIISNTSQYVFVTEVPISLAYSFQDEFAEIEARVSRFGAGGAQSMESQPSIAIATSSGAQQGDRAEPRTPIKLRPCKSDSSDDGEGDEDEDGPTRPSLRGHKRKSILQPKGSKFSKKAAGRRNSLRAAQSQCNDGNYEDDEIMEDASPLATAITSNHNRRQPPSGQNTSEAPYHEYLPDPYIEVKLVHYDLPTTLPQGPGDLWSCEFEGCFTRIYEGSTEEGKEKIKEHFLEHAESAKEKINLVMNERRPYLPVEWVFLAFELGPCVILTFLQATLYAVFSLSVMVQIPINLYARCLKKPQLPIRRRSFLRQLGGDGSWHRSSVNSATIGRRCNEHFFT